MPTVSMAPDVTAGQVAILIAYMVLIIVGAYFLTKYLAKRAMQRGMKHTEPTGKTRFGSKPKSFHDPGRMLSVADRMVVDKEKSVIVVEFKGKYYLMSSAANDLKCIDKIPIPQEDIEAEKEAMRRAEEEAAQNAEMAGQKLDFGETMSRFWMKFKESLPFGRKKKPEMQDFDSKLKKTMEKHDDKGGE